VQHEAQHPQFSTKDMKTFLYPGMGLQRAAAPTFEAGRVSNRRAAPRAAPIARDLTQRCGAGANSGSFSVSSHSAIRTPSEPGWSRGGRIPRRLRWITRRGWFPRRILLAELWSRVELDQEDEADWTIFFVPAAASGGDRTKVWDADGFGCAGGLEGHGRSYVMLGSNHSRADGCS